MRISCSGIRLAGIIKLLPLQGDLQIAIIPRAMPWARGFWAFSPFLSHMRSSVSNYFESAKKMRKVWRFRKIIVNLQLENKD